MQRFVECEFRRIINFAVKLHDTNYLIGMCGRLAARSAVCNQRVLLCWTYMLILEHIGELSVQYVGGFR